jgi:opacity protein-like surface antigen
LLGGHWGGFAEKVIVEIAKGGWGFPMNWVRAGKRMVLRASASMFLFVGTVIAADSGAEIGPAPGIGQLYIRGDIGWSHFESDAGPDGNAVSLGAGAGLIWNEVLRSDVRIDWSGNYEMTISDLSATTLLGNTYIDIPINLTFAPYAGAGVGLGFVNGNGNHASGFTYGLMAGAVFELSGNLALDTGYRFREIILTGDDFTDHSIMAGALFRF